MNKKNLIILLLASALFNAVSAQIVPSDPHAANKSSHFIIHIESFFSKKNHADYNSVSSNQFSLAVNFE